MQSSNYTHYKKTSGCANLSGQLYEVKLACFLFVKGINTAQDFHLATNMESAQLFDDISFIHKDINNPKTYFIQLKHRKNNNYKIKPESLMQMSGDFSLLKYFKSYCDIKNEYNTNKDLRFCGDFNSFEFIIYTNVEFTNQCNYKFDESILNTDGVCFSLNPQTDAEIYNTFDIWKRYYELLVEIIDLIKLGRENDAKDKINTFKITVRNREVLDKLKKLDCRNVKQIENLKSEVEHFGNCSYSEFLNKLKICSGQASEEKLEKYIKEEIENACGTSGASTDAIFRELMEAISLWWDKKNYFLNQSASFWQKIIEAKVSDINRLSKPKIDETDLHIKFRDNEITSLRETILSKQAVHVIPAGTLSNLSCRKVYQVIESIPLKSFIFTKLSTLMEHEDEFLSAWETKWCDYFILEDGEISDVSGIFSFIQNLSNILNKYSNKKLILVGPLKVGNLSSYLKKMFTVVHDKCCLADFDLESETLLLSTLINFQGCKVSLNSLVNAQSNTSDFTFKMKKAICNDILCKIADKEELKIGRELVKDIECYIPQALKRQIIVKNSGKLIKACIEEQIKNSTSDCRTAISGMSFKELSDFISNNKNCPIESLPSSSTQPIYFINGKVIELRDSEKHINFRKLLDNECSHWFHKEHDKLIWKESKSDIDFVYQHLDKNDWRTYKPKIFTDIDDRIVLIIASPGMGKSSLLTHLAVETKKLDPTCWIVRVNLNDHTNFLMKTDKEDLKIDNIIRFLETEALKLGTDDNKEFEKLLFEDSLTRQGNAVIVFDGYDEISPTYAEKVSIILKELKEINAGKLYVTSRPVFRQKLEKELLTIGFSLQPFRENDQHVFLQKVWKSKIPDVNKDTLKDFVNQLLRLTMQSLSDKGKEFTGIPLQIMMLAEVFENDLRNCKDIGDIRLPKTLDLLQLYDEFIKKKLDIYYKEKKKVDMSNAGVQDDYEDFFELFMKNHMECGLLSIFPKESLVNLIEYPKPSFFKKIDSGSEKSGVIDEVIDDKPYFIHRTFAEYFSAVWFSKNFRRSSKFLSQNIFKPCYDVLKSIFDRILANNNTLHVAVLNNDRMAVELALQRGQDVNSFDRGGRTALHLALGHQKSHTDSEGHLLEYSNYIYTENKEATNAELITELLLRNNADVNIKDSVFCWTPLQYADKCNNSFRSLGMLLEYGANQNHLSKTKHKFENKSYIEENINIALEENYVKLIRFLVNENKFIVKLKLPRDNCRCTTQYSTLLQEAVMCDRLEIASILLDNGAVIDMKDSEGNAALHLSAKDGKLAAVEFLIKNGSNVRVANHEGETPLHLAAANGRLPIVKYLVQNGADTTAMSHGMKTALHAAACQDNLDVLKYLYESSMYEINVHACRGSYIFNTAWYYGKTPLHLAVKNGKLENVRYLVEKEYVDVCDEDGNTPLHHAVLHHNLDMIKCLIEAGANINKTDSDGETVIHLAADHDTLEILQYLEKKGARFDIQNKDGNSPLHWVAKHGTLKIVKFFARKYSNIDLINKNGDTPLMLAAQKGKLEVVKYLIEAKKANVYMNDGERNTALHHAAKHGQLHVVSYLFRKYKSLNKNNKEGETPLLTAAVHKQWDTVKLLAKKGANMHAQKPDGTTILHLAAEQDEVSVLKWILKHRFNTELKTKRGDRAVHIASKNGALGVLHYFSEVRAKFDILNSSRDTPLHLAVTENHKEIVKYLLEKDVKVNQQNIKGTSPLHLAVQNMNLDFVKLLVAKGADLRLQDKVGRTPLYLSLEHGNEELVHYLAEKSFSAGVDINIAFVIAVWSGQWNLVPSLVQTGADVNFKNILGQTALHKAAGTGDVYVVNYLINKGARVMTIDSSHTSPLHYAAFFGFLEVVMLLLEYGANVNSLDKKKNTALHCAAVCGNINIVKYLVKQGINISIKNRKGMTALDIATKRNNLLVRDYLKSVTSAALVRRTRASR